MTRFLLILPLLLVAATPVPVNIARVPLDKLGSATVESKPGNVTVDFERGNVFFTCREFGELSRWDAYAAYFSAAAAQAPSYPNADFGLIHNAKGVNEAGYCNGALYTRNGLLVLVVTHNKECFGAAGCISETIAFLPDVGQLSALANAIQAGTIAATAPSEQVRGGPDAVIYNLSE